MGGMQEFVRRQSPRMQERNRRIGRFLETTDGRDDKAGYFLKDVLLIASWTTKPQDDICLWLTLNDEVLSQISQTTSQTQQ